MSPSRQHERVAIGLEVEFLSAGAFLVAYSTNLSRGGMFVDTEEPLPVGTHVTIKFAVPGEQPIEIMGVVAWVQAWKTDESPRGMGIRFEELEEIHGDHIDRIVGAFRGLRIVVYSADDALRGQLARGVKLAVGAASIVEAASGEQAEVALSTAPDLVLVDLSPGLEDALDGDPSASGSSSAEALLCLRLAKAQQPPVRVLVLSNNEERRAHALDLGADAALSGLPAQPELAATVLRLLGKPRAVTTSGG